MVSLLSSLFDNVMARARFLGAERAAQSATGRPPWRHRPAPARAAGSDDSVRSRPSGVRKSVVEGKSVSVRVDLGGRGINKKTQKSQARKITEHKDARTSNA